jgi:hypothetical protein
MGQSGNPAKKAATKRTTAKKVAAAPPAEVEEQVVDAPESVSDIKAFKKRREGQMLQLPSELWVRARRVDLQTFILKGTVPNPLVEIIQEALAKGQKANIASMMGVEEGQIDLEMVNDMMEVVDSVVIETLLEPKVHDLPEGERDDDLLYVDEVDPEDKMFIFQWAVGGTSNLEQFRKEARADLDALAEGTGASLAAK